ncbi:MAG: LLM class flavin-dependent oxidoreductase [SAR202 cluster bacterium]|nr:LLM class flavin-dependent oxidoreductase [SAR202 cluster bacterium]
MEFGVFYQLPCAVDQTPAARIQDTIAQCQLADELGFDAAWLAELHFNPRFSVMPAPLMIAAAIAQTTKRIRIGNAVNLLALHQPVRLAEELATLDVLSNGRAIFGAGRGSMPTHFEGYGIDQEEGRARFIEALEFILGSWQKENFTYDGKYYQAHGFTVTPRPIQQPHPPVYVAANSADTFGIVGELGHSILVAPTIVTTEGAVTGLASYRAELAENGHDVAKLKVNVNVPTHVAASEKEAKAGFVKTINNYLATLGEIGAARGASRGSSRASSLTAEMVMDEFAAVGTPDQVAAKLEKFKELYGPQEFMCWFNIGGMLPPAEVESSMKLFAKEVMPRFK